MPLEHVVELSNLSKKYDKKSDVFVLKDVDLQVSSGEIFGLLGPNGAGKTTLLHIILGFIYPTEGSVTVLGTDDVEAVRDQVSYMPDDPSYHPLFSGKEYLHHLCRLHGINGRSAKDGVIRLLALVGLDQEKDMPLDHYSRGMLQRIGIAQCILGHPRLLILDEPASGLDPDGQKDIRDILLDLKKQGKTIILSSHLLSEVERVCDTVAILDRGSIAAKGKVNKLLQLDSAVDIELARVDDKVRSLVRSVYPGATFAENKLMLRKVSESKKVEVVRTLLDNSVTITSLNPARISLEELYLTSVKRKGRSK